MTERFRVAHLDDLERIGAAGGLYRPIRRRLGVRAFGVNAYTAEKAGDQVIERHNESGAGCRPPGGALPGARPATPSSRWRASRSTRRRARWSSSPISTAERGAVARADETTVLVIGGPADAPIPTSPFEYWFAAEPAYKAGDYDRAVEIASEGLAEWPQQGQLHYQLACFHALAGRTREALEHLAIAVANDERVAGWAQDDADLDSIRADPAFPPPPA